MAVKREKPEEIVSKLWQVEVLQGQGETIARKAAIATNNRHNRSNHAVSGGVQMNQPVRVLV